MTIRERIVAALHGQMPDRVPFVIYPGSIPTGEMERKFRNAGLGMHQRIGIYKAYMQEVKICSEEYRVNFETISKLWNNMRIFSANGAIMWEGVIRWNQENG